MLEHGAKASRRTGQLVHLNTKGSVETTTANFDERDRVLPCEVGEREQVCWVDIDGDDERVSCDRVG